MQIILTAVELSLYTAWKEYCGDLEGVTLHQGSILDVECDAVVSPANSFGFMDGGIDMIYTQHFGWQVQERLQQRIAVKHHGELLVGAAEIVETDNERIPFVIAAPTMRVPLILHPDTTHPYLAARATLLLVKHGVFTHGPYVGERIGDFVQRVAFPGLGTGVGRVHPRLCARQVRAAIEDVLLHPKPFPASWADAQARHQRLYSAHVRDLQRG
jgi:O-acetyl-ADP-ribose deacetylase (regulator of RNase III)